MRPGSTAATPLGLHPAAARDASAPLLLDRIRAAHHLGVSPATLDRLRRAGKLRPVRLSSRPMYRLADLQALVDGL